MAECMTMPDNCAWASPKSWQASINASALIIFAAALVAFVKSRIWSSILVISVPPSGVNVPNTPDKMEISSFCISLAQYAATKSPIAFIGSAPANAADRLDAPHIFCLKMVVETSLFEPILAGVISTSSNVASESPVKSSKNGILWVLAASLASLSNSGLLTTIPHWINAESSIVRFTT